MDQKDYTLSASLYRAHEEANFLLHYVWINVLGSEYHPDVKSFKPIPEDVEVELNPEEWMPLPPSDWTANSGSMSDREWQEQRAAFHEMSRLKQEAISNLRSRTVRFVILANKTDDLDSPESYQLTCTVFLRTEVPRMQWQATNVGDITLTNVQTGEQRTLLGPLSDCMKSRTYHNYVGRSGKDRLEEAREYFR